MKNKIVYSTEHGDLRQQEPVRSKQAKSAPSGMKRDGIVRVQKESKGRGGKTVTVIYGLPLTGDKLNDLAASLKQMCGTGGTVKDGVVMIQGDKADLLVRVLTEKGYTVKRAGG
jgi:translation initiation factor 1